MIPLHSPQDALRPTAIALGSFDGLHQGHRRVIAAITAERPGEQGAARPVPTVLSFWPHPREVLHGETRLRLDLPAEKLELLEPLGIRQLVLVPFDAQLAALSPEAFVERVLVGQLQARHVAVGDNFRFGAGRSGDGGDLARLGARHGIAVTVLPMLHVGGERVSSSRIRRALASGDITAAQRLLERPYRFSGRVVRGRGLGRGLGWPTANLQVDGRKFLPLEGVYAAWVWCHGPAVGAAAPTAGPPHPQRIRQEAGVPAAQPPGASGPGWLEARAEGAAATSGTAAAESEGDAAPIPGQALPAVMNLGPQPTVDPTAPSAVEVHLLNRRLDLRDTCLTVEPVRLLRSQRRFASLEELSARIAEDANEASLLLECSPPGGAAPILAVGPGEGSQAVG